MTQGAGIDDSERQRLTADYAVAKVLLDATSFDAAASPILQAICQSNGWPHGSLWAVDREHDRLRCTHAWGASPAPPSLVSADSTFGRGAGLPGRVWETGSPARTPDAYALPIRIRDEVFAVLAFAAGEIHERHESELAIVGSQIGLFVERVRKRNELSQLYDLSLDMLCVARYDGYMQNVNPAWTAVLGWSQEEMLARPWADFVHPDDLQATIAVASQLFAGATVVHFENRYFHKDGSVRWLQWTAAPPKDGQQVVYAAARDITERKLADELRAQNANLELLDELLIALVDSGDLPDVFARISSVAKRVLTHDAAALMVRIGTSNQARFYAGSGLPPGQPDTTEIPEEVLRNPDWEHDILEDLAKRSEPRYVRLVGMGFRSLLRVPIRFDGRFAGALIFLSKTASSFKEGDVLVARRMADRLAISVARNREIQALKRADEATERAQALEARVRALSDELNSLAGFHRVVGESTEWRQVLTQAAQVAATETTVLLLGESGTGKEVVARFVHRASPRKNGPFVALNCAALPEQLLEAELFGYERGAYTGATQSKPGQLEQAAGGTLFLDEVGEMSMSAQAKFLRVLQEREFQRLGGTRVIRSDARIVAATNRDLLRAISNGQFREDLYYRLNVFAIRLPALRGRKDDILPLSEAFLTEIGRGLGRPAGGISREARQLLLDYHWPGNVRELRNILERAAILCDGGLITPEHLAISLPVAVPAAVVAVATDSAVSPTAAAATTASPGDLQSMERVMIEQALTQARFNKSKAAKALGLTRHQLYIRMKKYGFE
jgi:PAS domain S-box-containing protein